MSKFVVSARKYRPVRFDEVVGQQHVSQTLKNALKSDHLAHAFLFCGPRGVGKTTSARILAKVLNCQNRTADFEPCNTCASCMAFNQNASFNITELDAASNNSVEHIRQLNEQVRFQPQQGDYKVFIIDEVHMLSQAAFNAFLKTLEEPPSYAVFILATTEKHKIIPTILSRCQIFDFRRIQVPDIIAHLESICTAEGIDADPDALHIIAQKADGALRDALSIFDRIVSFSGGKISYQDVIDNLNILDYDYYFKVVDALLQGDTAGVLTIFDDISRKGFEGDLFLFGLSEHLRNLLVCKDESTLNLLEVGEGLQARYREQSILASNTFLLSGLSVANECDVQFKTARNKRLHVELALIRMAHLPQLTSGEALVQVQAAPVVEKKTPELTASSPKPETVPKKEEPVEEAIPPPAAETPKKEAELSMDIHALLAEVEAADALRTVREHALEKEEVVEVWQQYASQKATPSLKNIMQKSQIETEQFQVSIKVGSKLAVDTIKQEIELLEFLKTSLNCPGIDIRVILDKELAVERPKPKTMLTDKDKYRELLESNPDLKLLRDRFDLRFDPD